MSAPTSPASEWRSNGPVVLAAFAGSAAAAVYAYSLGVMIEPLENEFGWTRVQIMSGFSVVAAFSICFSLPMGVIVDRIGPRRVGLIGLTLHCGALALLSQATDSLPVWWGLWTLIAIGSTFITPTVWVTAISSLFTAGRGLALAVVLSASGAVSFAIPLLTHQLNEEFGWRTAYLILGSGSALTSLPLVFFLFVSSKDRQRLRPVKAVAVLPNLSGPTLSEGLRSSSFHTLAAAGFLMSFASVGIAINLVPILVDRGLSGTSAAAIAGILGLTQMLGRLACGYLLDRYDARKVAAACVALPIATSALLLGFPGSFIAAALAVGMLGLAAGAEMDAVAYLSGKLFGLRCFAALFGTLMGLIMLGFGIGPVAASFVFDFTRSYELVLWATIPLTALGSFLFAKIGRYPNFSSSELQPVPGHRAVGAAELV